MKLLFENWRRYLNEQTSLFGYDIKPDEKVFVSREPYTSFRNVKQGPPKPFMGKPNGLWYSCGDSWIDWLADEMPGWLNQTNYLYRIELGADVYQISNTDEFEEFERKYASVPKEIADMGIGGDLDMMSSIDFSAVQRDGYTGVEICPYLPDKRFESQWYYPWDVASGCIWDSKGARKIELIGERT